MIGIRDASAALVEAQGLLGADGPEDVWAGLWRDWAAVPLAAILLTVANAHDGQVEFAEVRDVASRPAPDGDRPGAPSWVSIARLCPDEFLARRLIMAAECTELQRDSIKSVMVEALAR